MAAAAAVAGAAALFSTTHGFVGWDGTWVLQVVSRLHAGDVLYRDVFFGVPPLAVGMASAATRLLGLELFVLRLMVAAVVALSYIAAAGILRRVTGSRRYDLVLAPMILAWALPGNASFYQPLANLFLLVGWAVVSRWACPADREAAPPAGVLLVLAGAAAGLSWGAKQTTGTFAIACVLAAIAIEHLRRHAPAREAVNACGLAALGYAGSLLLLLAPVAVSGGWDKFLEYGFLNKTTYLRVAGVSYFDGLLTALRALQPGPAFSLMESVKAQPFLLALLIVPAAVTLSGWPSRTSTATTLALGLALAETATLVPRTDIDHLVAAMPGLLVVLLSAWHVARSRRSGRWTGLAEACCLLVVAATLLVRVAASGAALASDAYVWSGMPHLRHVLLPRAREAALVREAGALRGAAADGSLFLLLPDAGLYYLGSGLRNPTPFDYPLNTAFGRTGEADVSASIARGSLGRVCMATVGGPLAPARLQEAVRSHLAPGPDLGACVMYQRER
jgi:hypothetical protein